MPLPDFKEILVAARAANIPEEAFTIQQYQVVEGSGLSAVHAHGTWCYDLRYDQRHTPQALSFKELEGRTVCNKCVPRSLLEGYNKGWAAWLISGVWKATELIPQLERLTTRYATGKGRKPAVNLMGKHTKSAKEISSILENVTSQTSSNAVKLFVEDLDSKVTKALGELQEAAKGGNHQKNLLDKVQKDLVPDNWEGTLPDFDMTRILVGMSPPPWGSTQKIEDIIRAFSLDANKDRVLLDMPRYVYEYVQRNLAAGSFRRTLMQSVDYPEADVVETLKGIWSPTQDGSLRDLGRAVDAAKLLKE